MPPTLQPTLSCVCCNPRTEARPCTFELGLSDASLHQVIFDTSSNGLLSFNSYYLTALRRSAHSREGFAPLNRLAGLPDSTPADSSYFIIFRSLTINILAS